MFRLHNACRNCIFNKKLANDANYHRVASYRIRFVNLVREYFDLIFLI